MSAKLLSAALAASLMCASAAWAQDCSLKQIASLPMTTTASGRIVVPLKINGTDRLFAVNLDSSLTGVTGDFVAQQHLDTEVISGHIAFDYADTVFTEGEVGRVIYQTKIADVQIGSADVKDMPMLDIPVSHASDGVSGFLGTTVLKHFDVEFDFEKNRMNLYSQDHCPGNVVYWADEYAVAPLTVIVLSGSAVTQMSLDGKTLNVGLSLAPGHGFIAIWMASKVEGLPISTFKVNQTPQAPDLESDVWHYPFKSLSFGGIAIANPELSVGKDGGCISDVSRWPTSQWPPAEWCPTAMFVKRGELSKLHLYFAFGENKVYATAADAHK